MIFFVLWTTETHSLLAYYFCASSTFYYKIFGGGIFLFWLYLFTVFCLFLPLASVITIVRFNRFHTLDVWCRTCTGNSLCILSFCLLVLMVSLSNFSKLVWGLSVKLKCRIEMFLILWTIIDKKLNHLFQQHPCLKGLYIS